MEDFTPISRLLGGLLIGLAAAMLLLNGRIRGIVGGLLTSRSQDVGWRAMLVLGLGGALAYELAVGGAIPVSIQATLPVLLLAGLLVWFGIHLGSGCTSGHGLCGIARLSKRSIIATSVFFGVAIFTVFLTNHIF